MKLPKYLQDGSPLALYIFGLQGIAANHIPFSAFNRFVKDWATFSEDVAMLMIEDVTYGLRSAYLRRVAVPIVMAQREIEAAETGYRKRAINCLEQMQPDKWGAETIALRDRCLAWVKENCRVDAHKELV